MTGEKDIVLIHVEDKPVLFARIEEISEDYKKGWYHVKFLMLQVPLQIVTWILRDIYIDGAEFTMNGRRMRLEKVVCPEAPQEPETTQTSQLEEVKPQDSQKDNPKETTGGAKVISFADLKK